MSVGHHWFVLFELHRSLLLLRNRARELRHGISEPWSVGAFDEQHHASAALHINGQHSMPSISTGRSCPSAGRPAPDVTGAQIQLETKYLR